MIDLRANPLVETRGWNLGRRDVLSKVRDHESRTADIIVLQILARDELIAARVKASKAGTLLQEHATNPPKHIRDLTSLKLGRKPPV